MHQGARFFFFGGRVVDFKTPNVFLSSSQSVIHVFLKLSLCSQKVPKKFPIAPHFILYLAL
jgi:hypothetical protein